MPVQTKCYCNVLAQEKGLDPVGYAHDFEDAVIVEIPLPWKRNIYQQAGALPQEAVDLLNLWLKRYEEGLPYSHTALMVAPDPQYSQPGFRRVMYYARPQGEFAQFNKTEYLVPEDKLGKLLWSLYEAREDLSQFEPYRAADHDATRDLLICTHGTVDAACSKFGYPLYNYLRKNHSSDDLRVWRVSHFGGHVFAPTMMDMPTGHYWAYIERAQADHIVQRTGDVQALSGYYRGWAGLEDSFLQTAERELWMQYGWEWFSYRKLGQILLRDEDTEDPKWAEVKIEYTTPDGKTAGVYTARVEVNNHISTIYSTDNEAEYAYPQYLLTKLQSV